MNAYNTYTDQELADLLVKGDRQVFGLVFKHYYVGLCYFANRYVFSKEEAEDIVEEVFENFWIGERKMENESHLRSYLYLATKRLCIEPFAKEPVCQKARLCLIYRHACIFIFSIRPFHGAIKRERSKVSSGV